MLKHSQKVYEIPHLSDWMPFFVFADGEKRQNASLCPMKSVSFPGRPARGRALSWSAAALLTWFAAGCASPRPPRAPSLDLPELVKDLTAQRTGDEVMLRWTTPEKTTDRLNIKGLVTAEICRIERADAHPSPPCVAIARLTVASGASQRADLLPTTLTTGQAALLAYRVQLFNEHGRSAGLSPQAFAASGAAPPPVEQLRAKAVPSGVQLEWQRQNSAAPIELDRVLLSPPVVKPGQPSHPRSSTPPENSKPNSKSTARTRSSHATPSRSAETVPPNQIKLETPSPGQPADPGGTIDATAVTGETYSYTAQRALKATLDGHTLTLRSVPSAPVTVAVRDIFPPAVPTGLEAVPGGVAASDRSIDLSWTPDTELDLAGYFVYRQEVSPEGALAGASIRLNQTPVPEPAYRDSTAVAGQRYAYRVTAVDTSGNESAPSTDVQEALRQP